MRLDILSSKPYPSVIPGFVVYLIKDNALNDLCGKTLGTLLASILPQRKGNILWGNMFLRDILMATLPSIVFNKSTFQNFSYLI